MKALTENKIMELYYMIANSNHEVDNREKYLSQIRQILACESNETKIGKFDLFDFTAPKEWREVFRYVHYLNGYRYATDTRILLKIKTEYPEALEGKSVEKDGTEHTIERLPSFERVIPTLEQIRKRKKFIIDFGKVAECIKQAKTHKKIYKKNAITQIKLGDNNIYVDAFLFKKFCDVLSHYGITEIGIEEGEPLAVITDEFSLLLMPMLSLESQEEVLSLAL